MPWDLEIELSQRRRRIDAQLAGCLDAASGAPPRLSEAMRYSLLSPGKRIRPILVLLAAEACGGQDTKALPAAAAVEMVHAYSLVHDDLPAMDDDDFRRGRPSCHRKFDEATAILVGDALLTLAFELLGREIRPADLAVGCIEELAVAAGARGMVGGQADDLAWEQRGMGTFDDLVHLHRRKTGALIRAAVRIGAMIGSREADVAQAARCLDALTDFADHFGLAFQISDDLVDVESTLTEAGKQVGKDAGRGKLTFPGLLGHGAARAWLSKIGQEAVASLQPLGPAAEPLARLVDVILSRAPTETAG